MGVQRVLLQIVIRSVSYNEMVQSLCCSRLAIHVLLSTTTIFSPLSSLILHNIVKLVLFIPLGGSWRQDVPLCRICGRSSCLSDGHLSHRRGSHGQSDPPHRTRSTHRRAWRWISGHHTCCWIAALRGSHGRSDRRSC